MTRVNESPFRISPIAGGQPLPLRTETLESFESYLTTGLPVLIQLSGPSGAGKSSFLSALAERLRGADWSVTYAADWTVNSRALRDPGAWFDEVRPRGDGQRRILILDQFEEVLRYEPGAGVTLLDKMVESARSADRIWHFLSFRTEYKFAMARLVEAKLAVSDWRFFMIEPITPTREAVLEIAWDRDPSAPLRLDGDAAAVIAGAWRAMQESAPAISEEGAAAPAGLVEVNALLHRLWCAAPAAGSSLGVPFLLETIPPECWSSATSSGETTLDHSRLFRWALDWYLDSKLRGQRESDLSTSSARLTSSAALIGQGLWSDGFKRLRSAHDLAKEALPAPASFGLVDADCEGALRSAAEMSQRNEAVDRDALVRAIEPSVDMMGGDPSLTAGEAIELSPMVTYCEFVAAFEGALDLLKREHVARVTGTEEGVRMVSLTHDALGRPLFAWSQTVIENPRRSLESLVAIRGTQPLGDVRPPVDLSDRSSELGTKVLPLVYGSESFHSTFRDARSRTSDGDAEDSYVLRYPRLSGLRWLGCRITAYFSEVMFIGCDLTGSLFYRSVFRDVKFINCALHGVALKECQFAGVEISTDVSQLSPGGIDSRIDSLAIVDMQEPSERAERLTLSNLAGSGLTLVGRTGPVEFTDCHGLSHVSLVGTYSKDQDPLRIESSELSHLVVGPDVSRPVALTGDTIVQYAETSAPLGESFSPATGVTAGPRAT